MPYRYTTFNGVKLPAVMTEEDLGAPPAQSTIIDSMAGGFNYLGNNRYQPKRHQIGYRGMFITETVYLVDEAGNYIVDEADNYIIVAEPATYLRTQVDDLKAQIGKWGYLVRRREEDGAEHYKNARLLDVRHTRTLGDTDRIARLELQFEAEGKPWRSTFGSEVTASLSANVWNSIDIEPSGPEDIRDAVITVTAGGTISSVGIARVSTPTYYMLYFGDLVNGDVIVIDTGAQTVTKNGVDNYAEFQLRPEHTAPDWLLIPGGVASDLTIYALGATAFVSIAYTDQWA